MLSGFNTNIRHRGVLFHVQTEDSGRTNPHVISHLFYGGNILASEKQEYSHLLGAANLEQEVRGLMEGQHKNMLKRLRAGEYDRGIEARLGTSAFQESVDDGDTASRSGGATQPQAAAERDAARAGGALPAQAAGASESAKDRLARAFGEGIVSQRPLDEVVLDYLVENARKRKRAARPK